MGEHLRLLRDLLMSLFDPEELRMFVHLRVDESLVHCLPSGAISAELLAYRAVVAFEQRGHLGPRLFRLLSEERPLRASDIHGVEATVLGARADVRTIRSVELAQSLSRAAEQLREALDRLKGGDCSEETWYAIERCIRTIETMVAGRAPVSQAAPAPLHEMLRRATDAYVYAQVCAELILGPLSAPGSCA